MQKKWQFPLGRFMQKHYFLNFSLIVSLFGEMSPAKEHF
jgi:hypothetical protein